MKESMNLVKVFEYALNQENTGIIFFQQSTQRMGIGAALSALKKLIQEEEKHILFINGILGELKKGGELSISGMNDIIIEPTNYFDDRADSEFLQQCVEGSMIPDVTIFNTAYLIERDLSEFYSSMAEQTTGEAREAFTMLATWEKGHEIFFKRYRDKLSEAYGKMPWGG